MPVPDGPRLAFPEAGVTAADVAAYYAAVAPVLEPHLAGRPVTVRRFPAGVGGRSYTEVRPPGAPPLPLPPDAVEVLVPTARAAAPDRPTAALLDLVPGALAGVAECAGVALAVAEVCEARGLAAVVKTSGGGGLQVQVPLGAGHDHAVAVGFARSVAELLERRRPDTVSAVRRRDRRTGLVTVAWAAGARGRVALAPYSLRAEPRLTVSTPVTWDEVAAAAGGAPLSFAAGDVPARVAAHGDLFAAALAGGGRLPPPE